MTLEEKLTLALAHRNVSKADAARYLGMSRQNFCRKLKRGAFTLGELECICKLLGAHFSYTYEFEDGTRL